MKYDYWFGPDEVDRRIKYAKDFKPEYQAAGDEVQRRITAVQTAFMAETGIILPDGFSSGWRPPAVNEITANAGKLTTHFGAQAGDKRDNMDGAYTWWCFRNKHVLEVHGLWMEHPVATVIRAWKTALAQKRDPTPWCHQQAVPPKSHARIYWPDAKSIVEWDEFMTLPRATSGMTYAAWLALQKKGSTKDSRD